jgi:hypothetical protein
MGPTRRPNGTKLDKFTILCLDHSKKGKGAIDEVDLFLLFSIERVFISVPSFPTGNVPHRQADVSSEKYELSSTMQV